MRKTAKGRLLKTKVREARAIARAETKARLQAEFSFKTSKAGWEKSLRDHIGRMIDRIDVMEATAIGGMTVLIHETVLHDVDILTRIKNIFSTLGTAVTEPWYAWLGGLSGYFGLGFLFPPHGYQENKTPSQWDPILLWVISFMLAFLIVHYFGEIVQGIGAGLGGLKGLIGLLI